MISGVWELVDLAVLHILRETGPIVCNHYGKIKAEKVMKAKFEVRAKKQSTTQTSHYRAYHDSLLFACPILLVPCTMWRTLLSIEV